MKPRRRRQDLEGWRKAVEAMADEYAANVPIDAHGNAVSQAAFEDAVKFQREHYRQRARSLGFEVKTAGRRRTYQLDIPTDFVQKVADRILESPALKAFQLKAELAAGRARGEIWGDWTRRRRRLQDGLKALRVK